MKFNMASWSGNGISELAKLNQSILFNSWVELTYWNYRGSEGPMTPRDRMTCDVDVWETCKDVSIYTTCSVYLSTCLSVYLSVYLFLHLSIRPPA